MKIQNSLGEFVVAEGKNIGPGDVYLAKRNTGWKLLECKEHNQETGVVFPSSMDYAYDSWECLKIIEC